MSDIHETAVVHPNAIVGEGCRIGPYCVLGPRVKLGPMNELKSHVVIDGNTSTGSGNVFFPFCSVGSNPQDLKYRGEDSRLEIGDNNIIREYATLQPGTQGGGMLTKIGSGNLFMVSSHVGHDCSIGSNNVFANSVALSGHVTIGDRTILGGISAVHQFTRVGDFGFVSGGAMVSHDVPPYCYVHGDKAHLRGINKIGLERAGFSREVIRDVQRAYKLLFLRKGGSLKSRAQELLNSGISDELTVLVNFVLESERGVCATLRDRETIRQD